MAAPKRNRGTECLQKPELFKQLNKKFQKKKEKKRKEEKKMKPKRNETKLSYKAYSF